MGAPGWPLDEAEQWYVRTEQLLASRLPLQAQGASSCANVLPVDVVVAHCNEDLQWLQTFRDFRIFVYQKCDAPVLPSLPCASVVQLPNLAMESLAYASHMVRLYDDFAEHTIFIQGSPFEHAPRALLEDVVSSLRLNRFTSPFLHLNSRRFLSGNSICLQDLYQRLFDAASAPVAFGSYCCSQFVVRRDRLLSRPRAIYEKVIAYLLGELPLLCTQDNGYDARPRIAV